MLGVIALSGGLASAVSAGWWWIGVARGRDDQRPARAMTWAMLAFAVMACAVLVWALVVHDFSVRYVAENGARAVPLYYTVISLWAALEGSLLLWLLVLTGYGVLLMRAGAGRAEDLRPWAMVVLSGVAVFFFGLALFAGNAFQQVSPVPPDGPGPNPLLQDHPLMGIHPPLLYLGYVGMTVPFAYAVAALVTGNTGRGWVQATRRWTLVAWTCLTVGILLGGWWSYEVLGWGGYWAWDPVENASIIPWFTATAFLHSIMVQERRAMLRVWNLALAVATFLLVLVGTFLTRSGVIASVHAFTQSAIGPILLGFLLVVFLGAGSLFIWRADRLGPDGGLDAVLSRESMFLGNNVVLLGLAFTVLIGTVFPLMVEAINGQRVSVGAPYFNRMAVPLALTLLVLMGIGPLLPWATADPRALARRLAIPAAVGLATVGVLGLVGLHGVGPVLTFGLAAFVLATVIEQFIAGARAVRDSRSVGWLRSFGLAVARRRRLYGGLTVHLGVVLAAVAIAGSSAYAIEGEQALEVGESLRVGDYTATLVGIDPERTPRRMAITARVALDRGGTDLGVHAPALSFYPSASQAIGTPSVETGGLEDAYLVLTSVNDARTAATIRLAINPLVLWLWVAGGVMLTGVVMTGWPGRRRAQPADEMAGPVAEEVGV
jgi:cytochrome c-type biogenesis protein CcmF